MKASQKVEVKMRFKKQECKPWIIEMFKELSKNKRTKVKDVEKVVCFLATPRCGSTVFCEALYRTGQIGICEEWFNAEYFYGWQQVTDLDFTLKDYLLWVIEHSTKEGVFACKWHIGQVAHMIEDFKFGLDNFKFDHVFLLRRRDKIAQAVSFAKAMLSNQFRHYEKSQSDELPSFRLIGDALMKIADHEEFYFRHLLRDGHRCVWYEDYQDLNPVPFNEVLQIIGKQPQEVFTTKVKKQRNETTKKLCDDYKLWLGVKT